MNNRLLINKEGGNMPGFILHLLHGKMFLDKSDLHYSKNEIKQFQMGLLMPDANKVKKEKNDLSHFFSASQEGKILQVPDLNSFKYRAFIDNPYVLGYVAHLYLDRYFFEDYFQKFVRFLDINGNSTLEKAKIKQVFLTKDQKYISVEELFSEKYLYGDYTMLNQYLAKKYCIKMVHQTDIANIITEVNIEDFNMILEALQRYLNDSSGNIEMNVFTIESLEIAIERYAFGFEQWADGVKSMLSI